MKNWWLTQCVRWGKPKPHPAAGRVLVVATTALGDTLWATPALRALHEQGFYVGVLTSPIGAEILKHNPFVDSMHLLQNPLSLRRVLYPEQFDTVLIFHTSQRFVLPLVSLIGATRIIGTPGINKGLDHLLTQSVPAVREHEIVRRLKIVETLGVPIPQDHTLSFFLQPEEKLPPRQGRPWVALHPGSQDRFKRWPASHFIAVGCRLKAAGCEILITGNAKERDLMREVARQIPGAELDVEKRPLRSFAALLDQMDLLISNDTGPTHLAWALNRPAISLFSPTNPLLCGPHQAPQGIAIARPPTCSPCLKRACRSPFCLLQIGVDEVVEKGLLLLKRNIKPSGNYSAHQPGKYFLPPAN